MEKMEKLTQAKLRFLSELNELDARHYVGLWAMEIGWGGIRKVSRVTGKSVNTIRKGIAEIKSDSYKKLKKSWKNPQKGWRKEEGGR